jgi:hypothetical protein
MSGPTSGSGPEPPSNVIALSRYRAQLGRGKKQRRADALLSLPHPEQAIRALPGDELYYVLHETGLRDALDILVYASGEQVQVALDFGIWERDAVVPGRLREWMEVLAEMPFDTLGDWLPRFDTELVGLLICKSARIYDLSLEEPPDESQGIFFPTPDRLFVLDVVGLPEDEREAQAGGLAPESQLESAQAMIRIIENLYRSDANLARRILVGARSELESSLEEMAYRWRSGRMEDLGFADYYEALEAYRELDPASVHLGEGNTPSGAGRVRPAVGAGGAADSLRSPLVLAERLGGSSIFARTVGQISSAEEVAELHYGLVALTNRVLAADRVAPGDDEEVAAALERLQATLDLAVEFLARGDEERAQQAVRTVPLLRLFRLGVSLIGKVSKLARALRRGGPFAVLGHDLFEEPDEAVMEAVSRVRPLFPRVLDSSPTPGERPFASIADLATATAAVERAAAAQALLVGLGVRAEQLTPEALDGVESGDSASLDAGVIARTALVARLLGPASKPKEPAPLRPLSPEEVREFARQTERGREAIKQKASEILDAVRPARLGEAAAEVARRWIAGLDPLEPVLIKRPPPRRPARKR